MTVRGEGGDSLAPFSINPFPILRRHGIIDGRQTTEARYTMEKRELAVNLKREGHNCCQAVLAAYANETGLPEDKAHDLMEALTG